MASGSHSAKGNWADLESIATESRSTIRIVACRFELAAPISELNENVPKEAATIARTESSAMSPMNTQVIAFRAERAAFLRSL